jgi:DNA gyrase subunit A
MTRIAELKAILADEEKVLDIIREELSEVKAKFNDERRTVISMSEDHFEDEDLIPRSNIAITISHHGYIKRLPISTYRNQRRGGKGIQAMGTNDNDFVQHLFTTSSHHTILFFTNKGKVYRLKGYEIPELGRTAKGIPIINLLQIEQGEYISTVIPIEEFTEDAYLFFLTKYGVAKRTELSSFANIRKGGLFAINLREEDELHGVRLTDGKQELIIGTKQGMSIRFPENDVRLMGRTAAGVRGISLSADDHVVGMDIIEEGHDVLIVTEKGYGKRTPIEEYRIQNRGGKGIKTCNITDRNGSLVALKVVSSEHDIMIITASGIIIRTQVEGISTTGRNTQGVTLIRVSEGEEVATVARVDIDDVDDGDIEGSDEETNEESNEETIETIEENEPVDEKDE